MALQCKAVEIYNINLSLIQKAPKAYCGASEDKELTRNNLEQNMTRRQLEPTGTHQQPSKTSQSEGLKAADKRAQGGRQYQPRIE